MRSFRENPDSEECQKMTKENESYVRLLQHSADYYENQRLAASEICRHSYREDSTVCEKCGA